MSFGLYNNFNTSSVYGGDEAVCEPLAPEGFEQLSERFPGLEDRDPEAFRSLAEWALMIGPLPYIERVDIFDATWRSDVDEVLGRARGDNEDSALEISEEVFVTDVVRRAKRAQSIETLMKEILRDDSTLLDIPRQSEEAAKRLDELGFSLYVHTQPSPVFQEGRIVKIPLTALQSNPNLKDLVNSRSVRAEDGMSIPSELEFLFSYGKRWLKIDGESPTAVRRYIDNPFYLLEQAYEESPDFANRRMRYGTKAAWLMELVDILSNPDIIEGYPIVNEADIPPFFPVSVDLYEKWLEGPAEFDAACELLRLQACQLTEQYKGDSLDPLVIIRSSAVHSEDGEQHSGAGVYDSVTVDPSDQAAFKRAVEAVFDSVDSENAQSYREHIGVTSEQMGLIVQLYIEQIRHDDYFGTRTVDWLTYGHVDSEEASPELIVLRTKGGSSLYDKRLTLEEGYPVLHTHSDRDTTQAGVEGLYLVAPFVAALTEATLNKPVQIEFAGNMMLQVRPFVNANRVEIEWPDEPALYNASAVVSGDMVLEELPYDDNRGKEGFVVIKSEHVSVGQSVTRLLPDRGAVILLYPDSAGHVRSLCRERGIMCIFVDSNGQHAGVMRKDFDTFDPAKLRQYRFVSDGHAGGIYEVIP